MGGSGEERAALVARLRAAGCVFAEEEAAILEERAAGDDALLERLALARIGGAPLEPLVGWSDFGDLRLAVGPGVFVPRQRTLVLAEAAVQAMRGRAADAGSAADLVFVEAFAGAAPVAATVRAALPQARVLACERDAAALGCAARNLGSPERAYRADVLLGLPGELRGRVDVIAAVPPYVPSGEVALLPREAREHEPLTALSGGPDGLRWIRALIEQAPGWLAPGGELLIELHRSQRAEAVRHARTVGMMAVPSGHQGQTVVLALRRPDGTAGSPPPGAS